MTNINKKKKSSRNTITKKRKINKERRSRDAPTECKRKRSGQERKARSLKAKGIKGSETKQ